MSHHLVLKAFNEDLKLELVNSFIVESSFCSTADLSYVSDDDTNCIDINFGNVDIYQHPLCNYICLCRELELSLTYRNLLFQHFLTRLSLIKRKRNGYKIYQNQITGDSDDCHQVSFIISINMHLIDTNEVFVDIAWNKRILHLLVIRFKLEDSLAWLSTLGGAYSSLGERDINFARKAGKITVSQLRLACQNSDPNLIAKCGIYAVHSLCQQGKKRRAIHLIRNNLYPYISSINNCDNIVKNMYKAACYRIRFYPTPTISGT